MKVCGVRGKPVVSAFAALSLAAAGAVVPAAPSAAAAGGVLVHGLTSDNRIVSFRAETPETVTAEQAVTGLQPGEDLLGLDVRPADGRLYALGSAGRLYIVEPATGAATFAAGLNVPLRGSTFGVDVHPGRDVLRVVSDDDQNLRVSPAGEVVADPVLAYATEDPGAGSDPAVGAAAYTGSPSASAAGRPESHTLYDIDTARDVLVTQGPAFTADPQDDGLLRTVGSLGVGDVTAVAGLDVDPVSGTAYAVLRTASGTGFYRVDLGSGAATLTGSPPHAALEDVAVASPRYHLEGTRVREGTAAQVTVRRTGDLADASTVDVATADGTARSGDALGGDFSAGRETVSFAPGVAQRTVAIPTHSDGFVEGDEAFTVVLSNPRGATLGQASASVVVEDAEDGRTFGLTTRNELVVFAVRAPATVTSPRPVTGLQPGEDLVGIDVRPGTGELFALGSSARLYVVDPTTGAATERAVLATPLSEPRYGVDVDPAADRLRVVGSAGQDVRVDPDTGATTAGPGFAYAAGDPGAGASPRVVALGQDGARLLGIDASRDALVRETPAGAVTVGRLGLALPDDADAGLDLAPGGAAFALLAPAGGAPALYRVDTASGAATLLGAVGSHEVEDLAVARTACRVPPRVGLAPAVVVAGRSAIATVRSTPGAVVDLFAYSRPSTAYRRVRTSQAGADGALTWTLFPPTNTRLVARQRGCEAGPSAALPVRSAVGIAAIRNGVRDYTFTGGTLPRRPGQLVSLYYVGASGRAVLAAQTRTDAAGRWRIDRRFHAPGRFPFVARTSGDLTTAAGASVLRPTVIH